LILIVVLYDVRKESWHRSNSLVIGVPNFISSVISRWWRNGTFTWKN